MRREVFQRAGLAHSRFSGETDASDVRLARGYYIDGGREVIEVD
jgi:hypothetical protein